MPEVTESQDLDVTLTDLVDHSEGFVEDLSDRDLMPLGNDPALVRHITRQVDPSKKAVQPLLRRKRTVGRDVVDGGKGLT